MPRLYAALCAFCLALGFMVGRGTVRAKEVHPQYGLAETAKANANALVGEDAPELTECEQIMALWTQTEMKSGILTPAQTEVVYLLVKRSAKAREMVARVWEIEKERKQ